MTVHLSGIANTEIPDNYLVTPSHFDRLADTQIQWVDITEIVRPAINFLCSYPELSKLSAKLVIDGLKLNRKRYDDRKASLRKMEKAAKSGKISKEKLKEYKKVLEDTENKMTNKFWDV